MEVFRWMFSGGVWVTVQAGFAHPPHHSNSRFHIDVATTKVQGGLIWLGREGGMGEVIQINTRAYAQHHIHYTKLPIHLVTIEWGGRVVVVSEHSVSLCISPASSKVQCLLIAVSPSRLLSSWILISCQRHRVTSGRSRGTSGVDPGAHLGLIQGHIWGWSRGTSWVDPGARLGLIQGHVSGWSRGMSQVDPCLRLIQGHVSGWSRGMSQVDPCLRLIQGHISGWSRGTSRIDPGACLGLIQGHISSCSKGMSQVDPGAHLGLIQGHISGWSRGTSRVDPGAHLRLIQGHISGWSRGTSRVDPGAHLRLISGARLRLIQGHISGWSRGTSRVDPGGHQGQGESSGDRYVVKHVCFMWIMSWWNVCVSGGETGACRGVAENSP